MVAGPGLCASTSQEYALELKPGTAQLKEDTSKQTAIWGFDGQVPGPVLRARRGEPLTVHVTNSLEQPTSVHWHGLRIVNAMDGVPGLTQDAIAPGETFTYRFTPPDAGTFWYHPHQQSWEQVARGLYGALIVEEAEPVDVDRDILIVADDWRLKDDGSLDEDTFGNLHDWAHAGRLGNTLTLNAKAYENIAAVAGERLRLRLVSTANARILRFALPGLSPRVVAYDGHPVPPAVPGEDGIELSPGQRADVIVDLTGKPGEKFVIVENSTGARLEAGHINLHASEQSEPRASTDISPLPANAVSAPDPDGGRSVNLTMTGGAMRFLASAEYRGKTVDGRTLALDHKQAWAFNGVAGMPAKPLFSARRGETITLKMRNDTLWPHNIHLHGHHFVETARSKTEDGVPRSVVTARARALQDTILMQPEEQSEISFVADNPGKWMIHCHMLEHQASGMATWFEVT